jgi:hypothetical protein
VREDLEEMVGEVPSEFTNARILSEVRWDDDELVTGRRGQRFTTMTFMPGDAEACIPGELKPAQGFRRLVLRRR